MSDALWKEVGNFLIAANGFAAGLFAIAYGFLAPWYRSTTGRNIMAVMSALALNAAYFGWAVYRGAPPPAFYPVRALLFALLLFVLAQRFILFVNAQVMTRRADRSSKETTYVGEVREDLRDADRDVDHGGSGELPRVGRGRDDS